MTVRASQLCTRQTPQEHTLPGRQPPSAATPRRYGSHAYIVMCPPWHPMGTVSKTFFTAVSYPKRHRDLCMASCCCARCCWGLSYACIVLRCEENIFCQSSPHTLLDFESYKAALIVNNTIMCLSGAGVPGEELQGDQREGHHSAGAAGADGSGGGRQQKCGDCPHGEGHR